MATTKKNTISKEVEEIDGDSVVSKDTDSSTENVIKDDVKATTEAKQKKVFTDSDYILCRSVWVGSLYVSSQSGNLYEFKRYGSECEIAYRDLLAMIRRGSDHIFLPRFIILDEDFLADFPTIQNVYKTMYTKADFVKLLDLPSAQMKKEIEKLPDATKKNVGVFVAEQIVNGQLDSISKIRVLTDIFNLDFNLLSDLFVK